MRSLVVSSLLIGLGVGLSLTFVFGVCYKAQDVYVIVFSEPRPWDLPMQTERSFLYANIYGFPLAWTTVRIFETSTFLFREPNILHLLVDILFWGIIGGVPLSLWVVRREDITWKAKLLKSTFLATSFVLLAFSPQFLFYMEKVPRTYPISLIPSPSSEYVWALNIYYTLFGVFLLASGIVLIVASYYRHGETNLPMKI